MRRIRNPVISAYLQALLLTGARREEMAALRWADVDFQWRSMCNGSHLKPAVLAFDVDSGSN